MKLFREFHICISPFWFFSVNKVTCIFRQVILYVIIYKVISFKLIVCNKV